MPNSSNITCDDDCCKREAKKRKVTVTNTPDVLTESVAEHTAALIFAVALRIVEADKYLRSGKYRGWEPMGFMGMELKGKTLGIVGAGRIGYRVGEMLSLGVGMKVVYYDVKRNDLFEKELQASYFENVDDILKTSDVLSLHVPLLPSTKHLINEERLKMMKPGAYLINTSRGAVVDEKALVKALQNKEIAGAGLDVFECEPDLCPGLSILDNVVITPHIASATLEARDGMASMAAQNIIDFLEGRESKNKVAIS